MKILFSNIFLSEMDQIVNYLIENSGDVVAKNFTNSIEQMSKVLIANPEIGSNRYSYVFTKSKIRTYLISDFKYLVFSHKI